MSRPWHLKAFAALSIAVVCMAMGSLIREQGYSTVTLWGAEFGFARIKSLTFIVWAGERFRFPFDWVLFLVALTTAAAAIMVTRKHFKQRSAGV